MRYLVIEPNEKKKQRGSKPSKGRMFMALHLGHVCADELWPLGKAGDTRPVWMALAGTEGMLQPVVANLKLGRKARLRSKESGGYNSRDEGERMEFPKSAPFVWQAQRGVGEGGEMVVTLSIPGLTELDPGLIDPESCTFLSLPPRWWVEEERGRLRQDPTRCAAILTHARALGLVGAEKSVWPIQLTEEELLDLVPVAVRAMSFVERRTLYPLIPDPAFYVQLYIAGLWDGLWSLSHETEHIRVTDPQDRWRWARHRHLGGFSERATHEAGLLPGIAGHTTQEALARFLARQTARYQEVQINGAY